LFFDERTHTYLLDDIQRLKSVTQLVHDYAEPFDEHAQAERYARKHDLTKDEVLNQWYQKRTAATTLGTAVHNFAEEMARNMSRDRMLSAPLEYLTSYDDRTRGYIKAVMRFLMDFPEMIVGHAEPEVRVYSEHWLVAGTVDLTCNYLGCNSIIDWKTSAQIDVQGYGMMRAPIEHLHDCNLTHYNLQLSVYKQILARHYHWEAERLVIVHLKPNGFYETFDLPHKDDDATAILEDNYERQRRFISAG
jgi:ATP-dependent exoDNAse (exonuclease V) beta subunit